MTQCYDLSHLAALDLEEIWEYTYHKWSKVQADRYYQLIINSIQMLCDHPEMGKAIDFVKPGCRVFGIQSHIIVYKKAENKIWIDRVLHNSMDVEGRLDQ